MCIKPAQRELLSISSVPAMLMHVILTCLMAYDVECHKIGLARLWKSPPFETKVAGGKNAELGEYPYQVSIQMRGSSEPPPICSGSIISASTIITAARCVYDVENDMKQREVQAAFVNLKYPSKHAQIRGIAKTIVHPDYQASPKIVNDIALYILDTPLTFNKYAMAINLPENGSIVTGVATLSGWGMTSPLVFPQVVYPEQLQTEKVNIMSYDFCDLLTGSNAISKQNLCTDPGACSGDTGAPLVTGTGKNRVLVGIASWTNSFCGLPPAPTVYTNVASYLDFIAKNME